MPPECSLHEVVRAAAPRLVAVVALILLVGACATRKPAPVEERTTRPPSPSPAAAAEPATGAAATAPKPETDWRPPTYTVKRGDTLYVIALNHGLDYRELAAWNNIENLNSIRVGQVLRLSSPTEAPASTAAGVQTAPLRTVPPPGAPESAAPTPPSATAPSVAVATPAPTPGARNTETYKTQPKAIKEPYSEHALREVQRGATAATAQVAPVPAPPPAAEPPPVVARVDPRPAAEPADGDDKVDWVWPAKGKIVAGFSEATSLKGIDIAGASGQPVAASAGGKVVYAGTGLRGYGKLIIIKHNGTFLSAYAHNKEILVKEGQQVTRGQKIAEMGNTDADQVKLHFEIRRQGKPVDPLRYLPPA